MPAGPGSVNRAGRKRPPVAWPPMASADAPALPVALLSAPALGDGLLTLVLANNLRRQGRACVLHHDQLLSLRSWAPWATIEPLPDEPERMAWFAEARPLFVGDPALVPPGAGAGPGQLVFTKDRWDRQHPYLRSLQRHAERVLDARWTTDACELVAPAGVARDTHPRRIALHPFSARPAKDWPPERWVRLALHLRERGWEPEVLLAPGEEERWRAAAGDACAIAVPGPLDAVAAWLLGSAAAIAGDSGIGHLASAVGVPTLSLFRKASAARFWRPTWGRTAVVTAPWRLPGGRGHRHWGRLLSVRRVARRFEQFVGRPPA